MQISVSSEIENRIEDSNSTAARSLRGALCSSMPWVVAVMLGGL
jgi:hypothetical protein